MLETIVSPGLRSSLSLVVVAVALGSGCAAAQQAGLSLTEKRDFTITNKTKTALCTMDVVNKTQLAGKNTETERVPVEPGKTAKFNYRMPGQQDRTLVLKDCSGKALKEMALPLKDGDKPIEVVIE